MSELRVFLEARRKRAKRPCPPGFMFCLKRTTSAGRADDRLRAARRDGKSHWALSQVLRPHVSPGSGWVARCPAHDDRTPSLSLADGHDGRLLVKCWAGCSAHNVLAALRRCELIGTNKVRGVIDARGGSSDAVDRKKRALDLWNEAFPVSGTIAAQYLLARSLALPSLPVLRFHPRCPHPSGANLPAMIGLVEHIDHGPTAIHRTFISADGSGKAAVEPDKASLGPVAGGAVRLAQARAGQWLLVAEGLETTLSVMHACALPGWAALSAGGIKSLVLPPSANMVVICADNDANGVGQRAANAAAERFLAEGRRVRIALPPRSGLDFNDLLRGSASARFDENSHVA